MHSVGRRLAAVRALVGEGRDEFAKRLAMRGLSATNIKEIESGSRDLHDHERQRVAEACGISPAFFTMDLAAIEDDAGLRSYVESLDNELTALKGNVAGLEPLRDALLQVVENDREVVLDLSSGKGDVSIRVTRIEAAGAPPIPGETGRRLQEGQPTEEGPTRPGSAEGSDAESGTGG